MSNFYDVGPLVTYIKQKDYVIYFTHVPTDKTVSFPAFLTGFEDSYSSDWETTSVFGRMDPIYTFQQTNRTITFSINIPSADEVEAQKNLSDVRTLTKFLYPTYLNNSNATTISKAPLVRIKFVNLINTRPDGSGARGLLGKMQGVSVSPDNDIGYFDPGTNLFPKVLSLNISFEVIHESYPGVLASGDSLGVNEQEIPEFPLAIPVGFEQGAGSVQADSIAAEAASGEVVFETPAQVTGYTLTEKQVNAIDANLFDNPKYVNSIFALSNKGK
jgi:hypothetical protein